MVVYVGCEVHVFLPGVGVGTIGRRPNSPEGRRQSVTRSCPPPRTQPNTYWSAHGGVFCGFEFNSLLKIFTGIDVAQAQLFLSSEMAVP